MIKLISFDLDGTVMNGELEFHPDDLAAVRKIRKDIICVANTGRGSHDAILCFQDLFGDREGYVIAGNGATINKTDRSILHTEWISHKDTAIITNITLDFNGWFNIWKDQDLHMSHKEWHHRPRTHRIANEIHHSTSYDHDAEKIDVRFKNPDDADRAINLIAKISPNLEIVHYQDSIYAEITSKTNKGHALKWLMDYLNIKPEECMHIGDSLNDLPAFRAVGTKIAVGNAKEPVIQSADLITRRQSEGGFSIILDRLGLLSK